MKAVVSGATGFVGKWLVKELLDQNNEVIVIVKNDHNIPRSWLGKVKIYVCDLQDYSCLDVHENNADCFFHLAWAGTSGKERADVRLQLSNVQATCDAIQLASKLGCTRFIFAGSIMEYEAVSCVGDTASYPGMGYIYSTAKLTADFIAKIICSNSHMEYLNVIISNIFGIGEYSPRFLNSTIKKMIHNENIPLTEGTQIYDFIYVTDAVKQIILAAERGNANEAYYIGNPEQRRLKEFIIDMKTALKSTSELKFGEIPLTGKSLTYHEFDTHKLQQLGFETAVSFTEGVILTSNWLRGQNIE